MYWLNASECKQFVFLKSASPWVHKLLLQKYILPLPLHTIGTLYYLVCYFLQDGDTPIHLALRYGHVEVVEKLISLVADVNVVNKVSVNY